MGSQMGDPETKVDMAALVAKEKAEHAARQQQEIEKAAKAATNVVSIKTRAFLAQSEKVRTEYLKSEKPKADEKPKGDEEPKAEPKAAVLEEVIEEIGETGFKEGPRTEASRADEDEAGATTKPTITLSTKIWTHPKFMLIVERALLHLDDARAGIYQRGNRLVRLIEELEKGVKSEPVKVWKLAEITDKTLEIKLMKHINWKKRMKVTQNEIEKTIEVASTPIGTKIAAYALEMRGNWPFPTVQGVISAPTLKPSGRPLNELGYDRETGLMLINSPKVEINPRPTREDAEAAIELLRELFEETKFKDGTAGRAAALSLVLSTVLCGAIPNTPLHIVKSPVGGSGKTHVVQIASVIALGVKCVPMGRTRNPEEFEKRLASLFIEGRQLIFLDNHNDVLRSDLICQAVTGDKVLIRKMGTLGENFEVSTRAVTAATGNGISIAQDLNRRTLLIEIDTGLEKPQFKEYKKRPLDMILANRAKYIRAILTIPLAFNAAGCPKVCEKRILDFEDWERLVRFPLVWLGEKDPLIAMEAASETDTDRMNARTIRFAIKTLCGTGETNAHFADYIINAIADPFKNAPDLKTRLSIPIELSESAKAWREALMAVAGVGKEPSAKRLGQWFTKVKDVIDDGLVVRGKRNAHTDSNVWWVEEVGYAP
jgi:putative DNA primase/helicase